MPKEVEELVFVWASRLSPYPWVRFDYPFPFVIRSKIGENYSVCSSRGKRGELLERIDRQNSRFRTAKTAIIKFGLHASFVELESAKIALNEVGLAIHPNDHQARRRFVEWAQNEIAVVPDFHNRILFSDEAHFWLNGYVNKQNCRIRSEANTQVYVETPLHPEKLTVWCALWAGGILLQKR
ncbi:uncharacterized protein TNCV_926061 [Trichonephila clavipes]|nr:uncharacterized protein TNCV_926061 [Trichonephila clavipes]